MASKLLFYLIVFSCSLSPALPIYAQDRIGLSSVSVPDVTETRSYGIQWERMNIFDEAFLHVFDQGSFDYKLYPYLDMRKHSSYLPNERNAALLRDEDRNSKHLALLDVSPKIESCFFAKTTCLGLIPLSLSLYTNLDQIEVYFTSAIALRLQWQDANQRYWYLGYETKTHFDRNVKYMLKEESNMISLGASL